MYWRRLEDVLKTSWQDVLKMSWRHLEDVFKTSWRRLEDVLKTFLQGVLKTSWKHLKDVLRRRLEDIFKMSWRRLEDVWLRWIYWSWPRRLEDVFWRRMAKANMFVLIKTSWRCPEDVFWRWRRKTSSRRLHQDECLVGMGLKMEFNLPSTLPPTPLFPHPLLQLGTWEQVYRYFSFFVIFIIVSPCIISYYFKSDSICGPYAYAF